MHVNAASTNWSVIVVPMLLCQDDALEVLRS